MRLTSADNNPTQESERFLRHRIIQSSTCKEVVFKENNGKSELTLYIVIRSLNLCLEKHFKCEPMKTEGFMIGPMESSLSQSSLFFFLFFFFFYFSIMIIECMP